MLFAKPTTASQESAASEATAMPSVENAQESERSVAPQQGTGWHRHEAAFHIVYMLKGWARFMYENQETLVAAGDCVHQRPGIRHYLFDYSEDMEYLEIISPADFKTIPVDPVCAVPAVTPWQ